MTPGDFVFQIIGPLFLLIVLLLPILLAGLLFYLLLWLMDITHTVALGLMEGTLTELCRRRKKRLCIGGIVLTATAMGFLYLEFWFPLNSNLKWTVEPCTEEQILAEEPDIVLTAEDLELLDAILNAPEAAPVLEPEHTVIFPPETAADYAASYSGKPSEECEITLYNNGESLWEFISFQGDPCRELYISRSVHLKGEEGQDSFFKTIRLYREGGRKEREDILCQYSNDDGSLIKEILTHWWFAWVDCYTILFIG